MYKIKWIIQKLNAKKLFLKNLLFKKCLQNSWPKSWDQDKLIKKKFKINTKPMFFLNNIEC
jgi:hypothetical protein